MSALSPPPGGVLTCDDAKRLLPLYIDRECSADDARVVADHLVGCEPCAEEAAAARALRSTLREACREAPAPASLHARVRSALRHTEPTTQRRRAPWALSAVAAAIVGVVVFLPKEGEPPSTAPGLATRQARSATAPTGLAKAKAANADTTLAARPVSFTRPPDVPSSFPLVRVAARKGPDSPASLSTNRTPSRSPRHAEEVARRHERPNGLDVASPDPMAVSLFIERRLNLAVKFPPIIARGGQLLGARITDLTEARAAHVLFHKNGHKVSLFAIPSSDADRASDPSADADTEAQNVSFLRIGHVNVVEWERGRVRYALASDLEANDML
jgi:anti-sigma factor (TIGR02949 family)